MDKQQKALAEVVWPDRTPTRTLRCASCERLNEVEVPTAVLDPDSCECGACGEPLFVGRDAPLSGLAAEDYRDSLDRKSAAALKSIPGFEQASRWLARQLVDRTLRVQLMSGALRCGPDQFPELQALADLARTRLGFEPPVRLFLSQSPFPNAMTSGVEERYVVVMSALLDQMDDREVLAVLGHEIGHQQADHGLHKTMASLLLAGGALAAAPVRLVSWPLQKGLLKWVRCAELTADRAGLLASRDLGASIRVLLKLTAGGGAGVGARTKLDVGAFVRQARELETLETRDGLDGVAAILLTLGMSHPYPAWRLLHLLRWVETGSYLDILSGRYDGAPRRGAAA